MTRSWALFGLPFLVAAVPPPDAQAIADARCVGAMGSFADSKDERAKQLATMTGLYFLGRLDARAPGLDMEKVLKPYDKMTAREGEALVQSCIEQVQKRLSRKP